MILPVLLVALQQAAPCPPEAELTELRSFHPYGQVHGLGVSADAARAYLGEGAAVTILDLSNTGLGPPYPTVPQPRVVAKVPVDASICDLLPVGDDLWIAGGSQGLLHMDVSHPQGTGCPCDAFASTAGCFPVTLVDDDDPERGGADVRDNDLWCFDVQRAVVDAGGSPVELVLALFASYFDPADPATRPSELRVYLRNGTMVRRHLLTRGRAYSMALHQPDAATNDAYVAMGTGGILKVDFLEGTVSPGPRFDPAAPPSTPPVTPGLEHPPYDGFGIVRDVALAGGTLFAAVDDWGLVAMPVGGAAPWPPVERLQDAALELTVNLRPAGEAVECDRRRSYAQRVQAIEQAGRTLVVVGGSDRPVYKDEAQPAFTHGRWDYRIDPGAAGPYETGWQALFFFEHTSNGLVQTAALPRLREHRTAGNEGGNFELRPPGAGSPPGTEMRLFEQVYSPALSETHPAGFVVHDFVPAGTTPNPCDPPNPYPGRLDAALAYGTWGRTPTSVTVSLQNPHLLWTPSERAQAAFASYLEMSDPSCPKEAEAARGTFTELGLMPITARWKDLGNQVEWFVNGGNAIHWYLHRRDVSDLCDVRIWQIPSPVDCHGLYGRQYFGNYLDRVLGHLLLTRGGTMHGGLAYKTRDLQLETATRPYCTELHCERTSNPLTCLEPGLPGEPTCHLTTRPLFSMLLHPEMETWDPDLSISNPGTEPNWRRKYFDSNIVLFGQDVFDATYLGGPRRIYAVAGGFSANDNDADGDGLVDDPNFERAQLVIVDLEQDLTDADVCNGVPINRPIGVGHGPPQSSASDVDVVRICGTDFAFVSDFGGSLMLFDLSNLEQPVLADLWVPPVQPLDGTADSMVDVLVLQDPDTGAWQVYCTLTRWGLVRLTLDVQDCGGATQVLFPDSALGFDSPDTEVWDTPGVAHYMTLRVSRCDPDPSDPSNPLRTIRGLIVADKLGGVRLYGEYEDSLLPAPTCPGR